MLRLSWMVVAALAGAALLVPSDAEAASGSLGRAEVPG